MESIPVLGSDSEDESPEERKSAHLDFGGIRISPLRLLELMQVGASLLCYLEPQFSL